MLFGLNTIFKPKYFIGTSSFSMHYAKSALRMKSNSYLLENVVETIHPHKVEKKEGFILVSNIKEGKNQILAFDIIQHFEQKLDCFGKIQDNVYYDKLLSKISKEKLTNKVRLFSNVNDVQPLLGKFELGLHTSFNETGRFYHY